jgi:NADH-quinone oxidoreductase subunit G
MLSLTINNQKVLVPRGSSVLEACKQVGIDIPRFCYHEKLSVAGNCRMCLVEIEKSPKPIAACAMPATNHMVIYTDSPLVKKARENVLEILLLNHPLDCPICDQGGECDLQDQTRIYGGDYSRFYTLKRSVEDKYCGPLIKTIMTRCIHCTRCVRFATEIAGVDILGTLKRGEETEIGAYIDRLFNTEISGNVIDLCPVGALTSKPYAFTARPWELRNTSSIDTLDCAGSNISVDFKESEIVRITPRFSSEINDEWISDKIRFSYDGLRRLRITQNYLKTNKKFSPIDWTSVLNLLNKIKHSNILIPIQSNIDNLSLSRLKQLSKQKNIKIRLIDNNKVNSNTNMLASFEDINKADACFLLSTNIKIESPVLQIRLRTQFLKGNFLVSSIGVPFKNTINTNFISLGMIPLMKLFSGKSIFQQIISFHKTPFFFIGKSLFNRINGTSLIQQIKNINSNALCIYIDNSPNLRSNDFFGIQFLNKKDMEWASIIVALGLEENYTVRSLINSNLNKQIVWASTHGSKLAENSNLILPLTTFFESAYSYINAEGREQKTKKVLPGIKDMIATYNLIKSLFINELNDKENKKEILELEAIFNNPNRLKKNKFKNINLNISDLNEITYYPLKSNLEDFYLNSKFTRASSIMGQCSQVYRNNTTNFF